MLTTLVALLAAATVAVPLTRRAGLGSVLGYLLAGVVIGPSGLRLVSDVNQIADVASLGVVMLLFLIGLELRPRRLWVMRQAVFGLGSAQLVACSALLAVLARMTGIPWPGSAVLGVGLAMSSTAIVLPLLSEAGLLQSRAGRDGFAVLLLQDLAFIPLVAVVPLLAEQSLPEHVPWHDVAQAAAAVGVILVGGRFAIPPLIRAIGGARTPELFTTASLLIVAGTAYIASLAGLSMSLGAFMAGVLLSQSEYRHELEADIAPFEGLLLGFFFISVGMEADLGLALTRPILLTTATLGLLLAKTLICFVLARFTRQSVADAIRFSLALPQASEFSFVLFGAAVAAGCAGCRQCGACHAGRGGVDGGDTGAVRAVRAVRTATVAGRSAAGIRPDQSGSDAGHHLRLRARRPGHRPRPGHVRDRVHRAGTRSGPGRRHPTLRRASVFR